MSRLYGVRQQQGSLLPDCPVLGGFPEHLVGCYVTLATGLDIGLIQQASSDVLTGCIAATLRSSPYHLWLAAIQKATRAAI